MTRARLVASWTKHPTARPSLGAWFKIVEKALWNGPHDINAVFSTASFVGSDRVVFDIGGNEFRLIVAVQYEFHIVYVRFFGTHAEYDRVAVEEV